MVISALLESPQVLIAEEEKIIVEEVKGDQTVVEEKYVTLSLSSSLSKFYVNLLKGV